MTHRDAQCDKLTPTYPIHHFLNGIKRKVKVVSICLQLFYKVSWVEVVPALQLRVYLIPAEIERGWVGGLGLQPLLVCSPNVR